MRDYKKRAMWPINCRSCKDLQSANIAQGELVCETCGSKAVAILGVKSSHQKAGTTLRHSGEASWGEYHLSNGPHSCPKCGKRSLTISGPEAMFD